MYSLCLLVASTIFCLCASLTDINASEHERLLTEDSTHSSPPNSMGAILSNTPTRALDLTRLHQRRSCVRSVDSDDQGDDTTPFSYVVSPLTGMGQLIVNPSEFFMDFAPSIGLLEPQNQTAQPPSTTPNAPSSPSKKPITTSYYPDWNVAILPPDEIQYSKYDFIYFAFAIPNQNCGLDFTQSDSIHTLDRLIQFAHGNGTKVVLSIGGWGGSKYFSSVVKDDSTRQLFVKNIHQLVESHNIDGIDIDWEYPGEAQIQDNIASKEDSQAMLLFLQMLRAELGSDKILAAAVTDYTFVDNQGSRMTDVTAFGKVLDYILVMNYDVWGSSSTPGPNAPFSNGCQDSSQPSANMVSAIKTWVTAGFPKDKILMGLAAYGYINHSSATSLVHKKRSASERPRIRYEHYLAQVEHQRHRRQNTCLDASANCTSQQTTNVALNATLPQPAQNASSNGTVTQQRSTSNMDSRPGTGNLDTYSGSQIQFTDLFKWGVLQRNFSDPNGNLTGINGYTLAWENCSSTPYAYCKEKNTVVTYDDAKSTGIKAAYALQSQIGGVGFWDMTGDYQSILIDAARENLGKAV